MTSTTKPIPEGYHTCSAYLIVKNAAAALGFYQKAFGAVPLYQLNMPDGKIAHAEFQIGDSIFMIADEYPQWASTSPQTLGGTSVKLHLYVENVDTTYADAINAGAKVVTFPKNQFWGDRMGVLSDPFGHHWIIGTCIEKVDRSEYQSRMEAFITTQQAPSEWQ